jgi:AhpD family alkylhydroperoxidase
MVRLEEYLKGSGLEERLMHLVKLRASQINGCAFCVDMHARDARLAGESERRVHGVAAFEESPLFTEREKAALAWAETVTRISENHAPEAAWQRLRAQFSDKEVADLTWLVAAINSWNRIAISFRSQPPSSWPALPAR